MRTRQSSFPVPYLCGLTSRAIGFWQISRNSSSSCTAQIQRRRAYVSSFLVGEVNAHITGRIPFLGPSRPFQRCTVAQASLLHTGAIRGHGLDTNNMTDEDGNVILDISGIVTQDADDLHDGNGHPKGSWQWEKRESHMQSVDTGKTWRPVRRPSDYIHLDMEIVL